jgi:hypothetical protein
MMLSVDFTGYAKDGCFDQSRLMSCAESALCTGLVLLMRVHGIPVFSPSVLFMYYTARQLQEMPHTDSGTYLTMPRS